MLTAERLRKLVDYDPSTGLFAWKIKRRGATVGRWFAGDAKGNGYLRIVIGGRKYFAHRLAWRFVYGAWPAVALDHVDGNGLNNRIGNLRRAAPHENSANQPTRRAGLKGVHFDRQIGKWRAQIMSRGKRPNLGCFNTEAEAHAAYCKAAAELHGPFARFH